MQSNNRRNNTMGEILVQLGGFHDVVAVLAGTVKEAEQNQKKITQAVLEEQRQHRIAKDKYAKATMPTHDKSHSPGDSYSYRKR